MIHQQGRRIKGKSGFYLKLINFACNTEYIDKMLQTPTECITNNLQAKEKFSNIRLASKKSETQRLRAFLQIRTG